MAICSPAPIWTWHALLESNFARRDHPVQGSEYTVWDTELVWFGLRVRPTGKAFWTVRLRRRGKQRRVTIGRIEVVDAGYLSPLEYRRLGKALRAAEVKAPAQVTIIRLLLYTGARVDEIRDLRWEWAGH